MVGATKAGVSAVSALQLMPILFDLRGRCNRTGLLVMACAMLVIQFFAVAVIWGTGADFTGSLVILAKFLFLWIATAAIAKRLHDIGVSAWWIPISCIGLVVWSFVQTLVLFFIAGHAILDVNGPMFWVSVAGTMTPVLAATVWLHFAKGVSGANRYGPQPGSSGFSTQTHEINRPIRVPVRATA